MARGHGLADHVIAQQHGRVRARERRLPDEGLVDDEAEAVDVGLHRRALPLDALGRDVHRGRVQLRRVRILLRRARDAEVADLRGVVRVEEDVGGLHVGVDDALGVREGEPVGHFDRDPHGVARLERARALDPLLQRTAG